MVFIKPELLEGPKGRVHGEEGCVSSTRRVQESAARHHIRVRAWDATGKAFRMDEDGDCWLLSPA